MKNYIVPAVIAIVVVVLGFVFYVPSINVGATSSPDHYGLEQFFGGLQKGSVLATSTPTATLVAGYTFNYDTVIVTPTGAAAAKTLTFFASSTALQFIPKAGMRQQVCFLNSTTTAAATLTFAAGTGIDLQVATSTGSVGGAMDLTVSAGGTACFEFIRKAATASTFDIEANMVEYSDAD